MRVYLFMKFYTTIIGNKINTLTQSFVEICLKTTKLHCFNQDTPNTSVVQNWVQVICPGFIEKNDCPPPTVHVWSHWSRSAITSGAPCWKNTMNSSQRLRWPMSWQSPRRSYGNSCHKNTSTMQWRTSPQCLTATMAVAANAASVLSLHPHLNTNKCCCFQSHQQTTGEDNASEWWEMGRGGLSWKSTILSLLDVFQQYLTATCIFVV